MRPPSVMIGVMALSCVALAGRSPVFAQSFTFVSSTQTTCWEDTEGFDANLQPLPVPSPPPPGTHFVRRAHLASTGTTTFNLDGTFTAQDETSTVRTGGVGFGETHATCNGTVVAFNQADQTLHTSRTCTFADSIPTANTGTVTGIEGVSQVVMQGGQVVLVHTGPQPPVVETVNVNVAGGGAFTYFRLCTRTGSSFFLH